MSLLLRFDADYYLKYLFKFYAFHTNTYYTCLFIIRWVCINIFVTGIGVAFFLFRFSSFWLKIISDTRRYMNISFVC